VLSHNVWIEEDEKNVGVRRETTVVVQRKGYTILFVSSYFYCINF
jgi:hypothetical protein